VNVSRGLKTPVRFGRFAVIEAGTNSVKFVIGERGKDGEWRTVVDRAEVTRRGEGLDRTGELNEDPIRRTVEAIANMAEEANRHAVAAVVAVGTAACGWRGTATRSLRPSASARESRSRSSAGTRRVGSPMSPADQRREIVGLQPKRAEVIPAGACIVRTVLEKLGSESLTVSDRGLRHGLLEERFGRV